MKTKFFYTHDGTDIAMIGKSGSSAIARAIVMAERPYYEIRGSDENVAKIGNAAGFWQALVTKTETPTSPIIPVRDPVERFCSACAQDSVTDVDSLLDKLEAGEKPSGTFHYRPTSDYLVDGCKLYKFPDHIPEIATALGLPDIPQVNDNESNNIPKPDLTPSQLERVTAIYLDDIELFNSITEVGQLYTAPPVEPTEAEILRAIHDTAAAAFESLPLGKQALWEGVRAKVSEAILVGNMAKAVEILQTTPTIYPDTEVDRDAFLALFSQ